MNETRAVATWRKLLNPRESYHGGFSVLSAAFMMYVIGWHSPSFVAICGAFYWLMAIFGLMLERHIKRRQGVSNAIR